MKDKKNNLKKTHIYLTLIFGFAFLLGTIGVLFIECHSELLYGVTIEYCNYMYPMLLELLIPTSLATIILGIVTLVYYLAKKERNKLTKFLSVANIFTIFIILCFFIGNIDTHLISFLIIILIGLINILLGLYILWSK